MRVQKKEDVTVPDDVAAVPQAVPVPVPAAIAVPKTAVPKVVPVTEARPFELAGFWKAGAFLEVEGLRAAASAQETVEPGPRQLQRRPVLCTLAFEMPLFPGDLRLQAAAAMPEKAVLTDVPTSRMRWIHE